MKEIKFPEKYFDKKELSKHIAEIFGEEYVQNLYLINKLLKKKIKKISLIPIIQILDHSEDLLSFIDIGIFKLIENNNFYLVCHDFNTKNYDHPVIVKEYKSMPKNKEIKSIVLRLIKKKKFPKLEDVCNMVYLNQNLKWDVNELVKFFKPFHKSRYKYYKSCKDESSSIPYQYHCIWIKFLTEERMMKEPSMRPIYNKVRRCITPEGDIVKNNLNPSLDFN